MRSSRSARQKDRSQQSAPLDIDLLFASDAIERFEDAWRRHVDAEGFPVCPPDDIVSSKAAANREGDRESPPRLRAVREYWLKRMKS